MEMSRSGFLKKMLGETFKVLPHVIPAFQLLPGNTSAPPAESPSLERVDRPASPWLEIGGMADFPPGSTTPVNQGQQVVIAFERGLYALDYNVFTKGETLPRRPLRLEMHGQISIQPQAFWPDKDYLSHLTGNRTTEEET